MLKEKKCTATSFFLSAHLDDGDVILSKSFEIPKVPQQYLFFFDVIYDPWIRAEVIDLTLKHYISQGNFDTKAQAEKNSEFYYVIHPFLKNAALSMYVSDDA
jgi:hypothetical protein